MYSYGKPLELEEHKSSAIGVIVVGDLNVHHRDWLHYSNAVTPEGRELYKVCIANGLKEKVVAPTRGGSLARPSDS